MKAVDLLDLRPKGSFMLRHYYANEFEDMEEAHFQIVDSLVFWVTRQDFVSPQATR